MPTEILRKIAAAASALDRIALAQADPRVVGPSIAMEVRTATMITMDAPQVTTLTGFNALLGDGARTIKVHEPLRGELLEALGVRILRLPANDQQPAIDAFLASARNLPGPRPALLDKLMQAAAEGPSGLARREKRTVDLMGLAWREVNNGENVQVIAKRHGISDPTLIARLERHAATGPAMIAVGRGEDVQVVAQRHGISDPVNIGILHRRVAEPPISRGQNVQAVAQRHGITDPQTIFHLEECSVYGPAGEAVRRGEDVQIVAKRYGISNPKMLGLLVKEWRFQDRSATPELLN